VGRDTRWRRSRIFRQLAVATGAGAGCDGAAARRVLGTVRGLAGGGFVARRAERGERLAAGVRACERAQEQQRQCHGGRRSEAGGRGRGMDRNLRCGRRVGARASCRLTLWECSQCNALPRRIGNWYGQVTCLLSLLQCAGSERRDCGETSRRWLCTATVLLLEAGIALAHALAHVSALTRKAGLSDFRKRP
jgi:hypothetical protein